MTEYDIQIILIQNARLNNFVVPNIGNDFGEMDVLKVSKTGYSTEYEIKLNKADFNKDKKKRYKHIAYGRAFENNQGQEGIPNYFIYVVPIGLNITVNDIPAYAGLYAINEQEDIIVLKKPPKIHKRNYREFWIEKIAKSLNIKYLFHYFYNKMSVKDND